MNRLDRPWLTKLLHGLVARMAVKVNANKGGAWNNTWGVRVNPEGHDHGLAMTLVGCPLADFAKAHGYTEIMPWLCRADEWTASAIHARLIRHHTVAQGMRPVTIGTLVIRIGRLNRRTDRKWRIAGGTKLVTAGITVLLCLAFWGICFLGTGGDEKNLKSYSSYPDEVQDRIKSVAEYQGRFKDSNKAAAFLSNFLLFLVVLFVFGLFIRKENFWHNFLSLSVMGQGLNFFDLFVIDLLWWRNTQRIRFTKIQEKELYRNPRKHVEAFGRAFVMYAFIALVDGFLLTLF